MKAPSFEASRLQFPVIMFATAMLMLSSTGPSATAADAPASQTDLVEKTRQMRNEMSRRFHQTWRELRDSVEATARSKIAVSAASVDLREQNDGYILRLHLPGRDVAKVDVTLVSGNKLQIVAPAGKKAGRYEQTIVLEGLSSGTKPEVVRNPKQDLIIVRVPKEPATEKPAPKTTPSPPTSLPPPVDRWDRDLLERMDRMRREMDQIFRDSFDRFDDVPEFKGIFDEPRFGSSVELQEQDGNYVVRAYLPDRDAENVKVVIEEGTILKIDAVAEESTEKVKGGLILKRKANYSQCITLPGPVDADKLKVDRKKGMLVITVPRRTSG